MRRFLAPVLALVLITSLSDAATWYVEKDGSGDFTVIQDAVDSAASGDTIRIGLGRFDDYFPYTYPGGEYLIIAMVTADDLTIIGSGIGQTVLGPSVFDGPYPDPQTTGIMYWSATASGVCILEGVSIENLRHGIYGVNTGASMVIRDCEFAGGTRGVLTEISSRVYGSVFSGHYRQNFDAFSNTDSVFIENCQFYDAGTANVQSQAIHTEVRNSEFTGNTAGNGGLYIDGGGGGYTTVLF